ncbi:PVC-type heme-binding CxxCH protein [Prosthecobacter sp.]|uniref:PVC-type heme-binding CxxCH protein n=1 Tax=Prosthecobacter sp. TaxID=1965333 RepID=UPI003783BEF1
MSPRLHLASVLSLVLMCIATRGRADIPKPADAPQPLSPQESARAFVVPEGMQIRLLAAEPVVREPSGICWDERGRVFVCELHGYNVEGQIDIDELNKSGKLDTTVRRIAASESARSRAEAETYGTVKLLRDTDGDGVMDKAIVWADRLPPCYGLTAANGGLVVACAPHIVFLKDSDGDDLPDVNERLFTGFGTGMLERGINAPTHGPDGWIYFGRGWQGSGAITGPHLQKPVTLPGTDFRIRADGSAIEPVGGSTRTIGTTFTAGGDRFVTTTTTPGLFVTPVEWRYLARNPDDVAPPLDGAATEENRVYPIAPVHPWRTKREQHAEYFAFYKKISLSDAAASGYFTSACSPLVYQHDVLPGIHGHYLVCEPAASLVHRSEIVRDGTALRLQRVKGEEQREFLASRDSWFHPVSLTQTPQGGIAICDFYREIIEDYSAIPRHLQQQYGVTHGNERGRVWLLLPKDASRLQRPAPPPTATEARVLALRTADADHFQTRPEVEKELLAMNFEDAAMPPQLVLQAALSLGQSRSPQVFNCLRSIARTHGTRLQWIDCAITSGLHQREREMLLALARDPGASAPVMARLASVIAARGNVAEIQACLKEDALITGQPRQILALGLEDAQPLAKGTAAPEVPPPAAPTAEQTAAWEARMPAILAALKDKPDLEAGRTLFTGVCASCHRSHGIGTSVGPDLDAEFQRAPETIVRDIVFPAEAARPGFETTYIKTRRGETLLGITASDAPGSLTLRLPGGSERTVLKKHASIRTVRHTSLMPSGLSEALQPRQIADIIVFLRSR